MSLCLYNQFSRHVSEVEGKIYKYYIVSAVFSVEFMPKRVSTMTYHFRTIYLTAKVKDSWTDKSVLNVGLASTDDALFKMNLSSLSVYTVDVDSRS